MSEKFELTKYTRLFGWSCKLPQVELNELLKEADLYGTAEDSAITRLPDGNYMIQNTDIFTPIVDDPYIQGKIAACNMTNDVFACGSDKISTALSFLAGPVEVPRQVFSGILRGMKDFLKDMGSDRKSVV